jgi:hypothetical protein
LPRFRNVFLAVEYSVNGRRFAQTVYDALKIAGKRQVERLGGPTLAATLSRALQSHLSKAISVAWPDSYMCIDQAADYDSQVGEPLIVRAMADALGYRLEKMEAGAVDRAPEELLSDAIQQAADVPTTFLKSAPGGWTRAKRDLLRVQIAEAQDALERLDEWAAADDNVPTLRAVG